VHQQSKRRNFNYHPKTLSDSRLRNSTGEIVSGSSKQSGKKKKHNNIEKNNLTLSSKQLAGLINLNSRS